MTRLLIIDDSPEDRERLTEVASEAGGFATHGFASGAEGLAHFEEQGADCVILDYQLETEDGLDVLAELKNRWPLTPVIMLTGHGNEEVAAKAIKAGAADYLIKQRLNETYLRAAVDKAISRAALETKLADQEIERRRFLNVLIHDLRAPLRNVRQFGELLAEGLEHRDPAKVRDLLAAQAAVTTRATDLIDTLESYALLDGEVSFRPVSLSETARAAKDNLATVILDRQAEVTVRDMPIVQGNDSQLTQLLQNLIGNGLKYNDSDQPQVMVECESGGARNVVVVVKDNGIGIPEKHLKAIFAPLKRLWGPNDYEGTGLGLAICQKIVERHEGTIWCTSAEGQGSAFHVRLPAVA